MCCADRANKIRGSYKLLAMIKYVLPAEPFVSRQHFFPLWSLTIEGALYSPKPIPLTTPTPKKRING